MRFPFHRYSGLVCFCFLGPFSSALSFLFASQFRTLLRGGVWGGFASEVYPPQQREAVQERKAQAAKAAKASQGKQKQSEASKSKQRQAIESARI